MTEHAVGAPLLRLPAATLTALHRALAHDRSPAEAARLTRQLGFEMGEAFHAALQEWSSQRASAPALDALPADRFWEQLADFFSTLGWGTLRYERLHAGVASLASGDWAEAESDASAQQPTCHLTTGLLADLMGRVAGTDLAVMEVECRSRGDAQCRFLLGSPEALGDVYEGVRQGRTYAEALEHLA